MASALSQTGQIFCPPCKIGSNEQHWEWITALVPLHGWHLLLPGCQHLVKWVPADSSSAGTNKQCHYFFVTIIQMLPVYRNIIVVVATAEFVHGNNSLPVTCHKASITGLQFQNLEQVTNTHCTVLCLREKLFTWCCSSIHLFPQQWERRYGRRCGCPLQHVRQPQSCMLLSPGPCCQECKAQSSSKRSGRK